MLVFQVVVGRRVVAAFGSKDPQAAFDAAHEAVNGLDLSERETAHVEVYQDFRGPRKMDFDGDVKIVQSPFSTSPNKLRGSIQLANGRGLIEVGGDGHGEYPYCSDGRDDCLRAPVRAGRTAYYLDWVVGHGGHGAAVARCDLCDHRQYNQGEELMKEMYDALFRGEEVAEKIMRVIFSEIDEPWHDLRVEKPDNGRLVIRANGYDDHGSVDVELEIYRKVNGKFDIIEWVCPRR